MKQLHPGGIFKNCHWMTMGSSQTEEKGEERAEKGVVMKLITNIIERVET
jgi:hypothetical protein